MLYYLPFFFAIYLMGQSKPPVLIDTAPPPSARFPARWYPADNDTAYTVNIEKNAPYTATLITTTYFVDPSTHQTRTFSTRTFQARDAEGRKRDETEAHEVTISDPVSHCNFIWMEPWVALGKPRAGVTCMPRTFHYINQNIWADDIVDKPTETRFIRYGLPCRAFG